jgi:hypothetical protein
MSPPPVSLSPGEALRLEECERVIQAGRQTFIDVGLALATIREERLYRTAYCTFEQYCRERWEFGARQAYRLCAAAEAVAQWRPAEGGTNATHDATPGSQTVLLPDSEKQVRALLRLPAAERLPVWREALVQAANGRPSSRVVEELVNARLGGRYARISGGASHSETGVSESACATPRSADTVNSTERAAFRHFHQPSTINHQPTDVRSVAEAAIRKVRELVELLGTPDSAVTADAQTALELLERLPKHLAAIQQRQASRT